MHNGHRARLAAKVRSNGVVYEHELLEVLLFNACPRRDVNATAHKLIARFGSIKGVLNAPVKQLAEVEGVGVNMAEYLSVLGKAASKCSDCVSFAVLKCTADFNQYLSLLPQKERDEFVMCAVDKEGRVKRIFKVFAKDGNTRAEVSADGIIKFISVNKVYGLFSAYVRPNGGSAPEDCDDGLCSSVAKACALCGARLFDFCVASEDGIYSYFVNDRLGNFFEGEKAIK